MDDRQEGAAPRTRPRRPPASVWIAVTALVIVAVQATITVVFTRSQGAGWAMYAFGGVLWCLLVGGLVLRSRLAWLWGRYLTLVLALMLAAMVAAGAVRRELGPKDVALALLGLALPLAVAGLALSRRAAYDFFGLVCPVCAARTTLGTDLLFRQARCPTCHHVW